MISLQTLALAAALSGAGQPILYDFYTDRCEPCRAMAPTIRRLQADGYAIRKVNIDHNPQLAQQFRIEGVPTFVVMAEGREISRTSGRTSFRELTRMIQAARVASAPRNLPNESRQQFSGAPSSSFVTASQSTSVPRSAAISPREAQARAMQATVRLHVTDPTGKSVGTGTIIDSHGNEALVLTCGHIFRDSRGRGQVTADLFIGGSARTVPGQMISYDLKNDVGIVAIRPGMRVTRAPVAGLRYALRRGGRVFSIGCDEGRPPTIRTSHITDLNRYIGAENIEVAGQPIRGRSGGGLFSADGQLIGVCNFADPTDNEGIYVSLPVLQRQLDKIGQSRVYQRSQTQLATYEAPPNSRPSTPSVGNSNLTNHQPPAMPRSIPGFSGSRQPSQSTNQPMQPFAGIDTNDAEVICIVRSKSNPAGKSQTIVLDRPSNDLLNRLMAERKSQTQEAVTLSASHSNVSPAVTWRNRPVVRGQQ